MKVFEMRQKSKEDLAAVLDEQRRRAEEVHLQILQKKLKDVSELGKIRRRIARILTIIREKI